MTKVRLVREDDVAQLILARPDVRNAFDTELIAELTDSAEMLAADPAIRIVVLSGEGPQFCAGADLNVMRASITLSEAENLADAKRLGRMFAALDRLPQTLIGKIHGAALGGGAGLAAVCDIVVAETTSTFGFTEVRLGLLPAVIGPYVLNKIGYSQARMLFVNGSRFDAATALRIGLIHEVVAPDTLDEAVAKHIAAARLSAPGAIAAAKSLLSALSGLAMEQPGLDDFRRARLELTAAAIAQRRCTAEAQAGLNAFLARTPAPWVKS
jgi:methylglutaconyl-CoA hydratase